MAEAAQKASGRAVRLAEAALALDADRVRDLSDAVQRAGRRAAPSSM
jgi:hypothetical protein